MNRAGVQNAQKADAAVAAALDEWERVWDVPELARSVHVVFSVRLSRTLGRATPRTGRVALHAALRHGPAGWLREVLCHEVAHLVAVRRAAAAGVRRPPAHGPEWSALVRQAGYAPVARARAMDGPAERNDRRGGSTQIEAGRDHHKSGLRVLHTCPVCHASRYARRAVRAWRCAECVAAGLPGELVISRYPEPAK